MGLQGYEKELAGQDVVGLAGGLYDAVRIVVSPKGVVTFDTYKPHIPIENQYIDLSQQNAVTDAIATIVGESLDDIKRSQTLQDLLAKPTWNYDDRASYESHLFKIISENHNNIEGLDEYRAQSGVEVRVADMGDLSPDVGNTGAPQFQHQCETMSSIEGIIATLIETKHKLLPAKSANDDDYKFHAPYIASSGDVKYSPTDSYGAHAFLMSPLTGNIIEGTSDPDYGQFPYADTGDDYSYADYVAGKLAVTQKVNFLSSDPSVMNFSISVYGSRGGAFDKDVIAKREKLIKEGDFDALNDEVFNLDGDNVNERYFASAFFKQGDVTFTVKKPADSAVSIVDHDELEDFISNHDETPLDDFDGAFIGEMDKILEDNGYKDSGKPVIIEPDNGEAFLIYPDKEGGIKLYTVEEGDLPSVPRITVKVGPMPEEFKPEPAPEPEAVVPPAPVVEPASPDPEPDPEAEIPEQVPKPETVEICPQLGGVSFFEFVDGYGILTDTGEDNDASMLEKMVQSATDLRLSDNVYGHLEGAMNDGKFLETAASIRAIKASHAAWKYAQDEGYDEIETERAVLSKFFENITEEHLIVDTVGADDNPFDKTERDIAREMAAEMDAYFSQDRACEISPMKKQWVGAVSPGDSSEPPVEPNQNPMRAPDVVALA